MDQVSRPMQVLLIGTLAFAALWFVALRPKADTTSPAAPAAGTQAPAPAKKSAIPGGLGDSVDKARATKAQGDAGSGQLKPATGGTAAKPAATPVAKTQGAA